jgi:hypothetical protein
VGHRRGVNENDAAGAEGEEVSGAAVGVREAPNSGREIGCRGWGGMVGKGERSCGESRGCGAGHGETRVGVGRLSGESGRGGQVVRLRFGARVLCWRYKAIYHSEIIHYYCCGSGGPWWRGGTVNLQHSNQYPISPVHNLLFFPYANHAILTSSLDYSLIAYGSSCMIA